MLIFVVLLGCPNFLYQFARIDSQKSGPEKGVITKGVFSLENSLESLKSKFSRISRKWLDSP